MFKIQNPNISYPSMRGYIFIPAGSDREAYIQTAFRNERVSVLLDGGGTLLQNVYISREVIQDIYFPLNEGELGSCVILLNILPQEDYVIISVLSKNDDTQLLDEYEFKKERRSPKGIVSTIGKGKTGEIFINVESKEETGGNVHINLKNANKSSKFNVNVKGDINLYSEGETSLEALKGVNISIKNLDKDKETKISYKTNEGFKYTDEFSNEISVTSKGEVNITPKEKFTLNDGSQKMVKGDDLSSELDKSKKRIDTIIRALKSSTVVEGDGGASLKTSIIAILQTITETEDYSGILSEKSFLE